MSKQNRETNRAQRAAAIQQEQARKERNKKLVAVVGVVLVICAIVAFAVISTSGGSKGPSDAQRPKATVTDNVLVIGNNPDAATKVVVFEDFLCPYCREFEESSRDFLHEYARKGKVVVEYRPFQLLQDPYSARSLNAYAAVLTHGTPLQALKFHDLLFDKQPYETASKKPDIDQLTKWAKSVGADSAEVIKAIKTPDEAFATAARKAAEDAKIQGTPTVLVNGQQLQGNSVQNMADNLQKMIAKG